MSILLYPRRQSQRCFESLIQCRRRLLLVYPQDQYRRKEANLVCKYYRRRLRRCRRRLW